MPQSHTTYSVFMVPPQDFCFNEQTGQDNEFQNTSELTPSLVREDAMAEFNHMVNILRDNFIEVLVLGKSADTPELPDAVFPNNWFSTNRQGQLTLYPMKTANRQAEVRPQELTQLAQSHGYLVKSNQDLTSRSKALEGTGSIIFDHKHSIAYAAISDRCDQQLFTDFCKKSSYQPIAFHTQSSSGKPFYHSNVMLSIGEAFAVVCSEAIAETDRQKVLSQLKVAHKQIIDLTFEQTEKHFCANILQLRNSRGELIIVMSDSAYQGFSKAQKELLKLHGKLVPCPINTIESIGGGSARCMLAENFLPKQ
ncbi:arginine deiminase-related protein [Kangiella sp. TOML190]|uniref:arginine deiminase-related protein n=1 Tax=Kangiella sp. TOML190 TaxID=2931351 RepID=UPI00203B13FC|nr:arginine deiminase-related protein [Kangiella sp. TOML190]